MLSSNDYYVAHEYLEPFNDPVYVHEFIKRANDQGCAYIGDVFLSRSFISWLPEDIHDNIAQLAMMIILQKSNIMITFMIRSLECPC